MPGYSHCGSNWFPKLKLNIPLINVNKKDRFCFHNVMFTLIFTYTIAENRASSYYNRFIETDDIALYGESKLTKLLELLSLSKKKITQCNLFFFDKIKCI